MIFILFILFILIILGILYHYNNVLYSDKRQIMLLARQNNSLKEKLDDETLKVEDVTLFFKSHKYTSGVLGNSCNLYIAPLTKYAILRTLNKNLEIQILDCVEIFDEIWYEVSLTTKNNINNKGWILGDDIAIFKNTFIERSIE